MPSSTFHNLSQKKQGRIIEAALDEFADHSYYKASVTRIVQNADIAKGSFYQYFEDKKDLFLYIVEIMSEKKLKYLHNIIDNWEDKAFFELLEKLYRAGIKFAQDHPRLDKIGHKLFTNTDSEIFEEIMSANKDKSIHFFKEMIKKGVKQGELDDTLDIDLTAHVLTTLNISLGELFYRDGKINMKDYELVEKLIYILKNGIKSE